MKQIFESLTHYEPLAMVLWIIMCLLWIEWYIKKEISNHEKRTLKFMRQSNQYIAADRTRNIIEANNETFKRLKNT